MSSVFGKTIKLSIFGQSHGAAIGMTLDGVPAGLPVDTDKLQSFLDRRAPGQNDYSTPRKEEDKPEFISGVVDGYTCGAPITAILRNNSAHTGDYDNLKDCPRPGHADYTAHIKYGGYQDVAGGGHFSGRLTAPLCIAGGLCKQWLEARNIRIGAHLQQVAGISDSPFDPLTPLNCEIGTDFPVIDQQKGQLMRDAIAAARKDGDSVGGIIECAITGIPAGFGDPIFDGIENRIAQIVFSIPAVKGVEFGNGFASTQLRGSQNNDPYTIMDGEIITTTNNAGGILGGITNGMPILFRAAIKPTPSIAKTQQSVSLSRGECVEVNVKGRHDPCIAPRAVPVVEAAAAIAVFDVLCKRGI